MKLTAYEQALHLDARFEKIRKLILKVKDEKIRESLEQILK